MLYGRGAARQRTGAHAPRARIGPVQRNPARAQSTTNLETHCGTSDRLEFEPRILYFSQDQPLSRAVSLRTLWAEHRGIDSRQADPTLFMCCVTVVCWARTKGAVSLYRSAINADGEAINFPTQWCESSLRGYRHR